MRQTEIRSLRTFRLTLAVMGAVLLPSPSSAASDLIGSTQGRVINGEETFVSLARPAGLGYVELVAANPGVHPWLPRPGTRLTLPTAHLLPRAAREGIVVNLADQRLYFFPPDGGPPRSYPVGIGREGWETPLGRTKVVRKRARPTWYPPPSIRAEQPELPAAVPPGPDNPLGEFALYLGWPAYVIHGTNQPSGVGRRVSHGCVRLYPEDIARLFEDVPVGTPVQVVDQPVKVGWHKGELYLEVHPTQAQAGYLQVGAQPAPQPLEGLRQRVLGAAGEDAERVAWDIVDLVAQERRGVPVRITY